ncbi:hypothetical protein ACJX0J_007345, partial [Zea mays]
KKGEEEILQEEGRLVLLSERRASARCPSACLRPLCADSCRTHCASRRSLRDDPNYDALIAALYPDIDKYEEEFQLFLLLLPVDGQTIPNLEKPYLSCRPTLSIKHLAHFVAHQLSCEVEELDMYIRMDRHRVSVGSRPSSTGEAKSRPFDDLERLNEEKLVLELHPSFVSSNGDM